MTGEPSLEIIRDRMHGHLGDEPLDTPPALYDAFRALAGLYRDAPKKKREFFNDSLPPHISGRHVTRGFVQAVEKLDDKTIMFLIESGLFERFSKPVTGPFLERLRYACLNASRSATTG